MNKLVQRAAVIPIRRRLDQRDISDLEFLWGEFESAIGVKGIDYSNVRVEGGEYATDPMIDCIEVTSRARRIRARLTRMTDKDVRVLFRTYGPKNRYAPFGKFGELSGLVMYTETAKGIGNREEVERKIQDATVEKQIMKEAERLLLCASSAYLSAR